MHWPQITMIVIMAINGGIFLVKHGNQREPYNFWGYLISAIIMVTILYFGGFWG